MRDELSSLPAEDWERVQSTIAAFEESWCRGERPAIEDHLEDDGPHREAMLVEMVNAEIELRIKIGEASRVEEYLARFPNLKDDPSRIMELICSEWRHRRRSDSRPLLREMQARFPAFHEELAALAATEPAFFEPAASTPVKKRSSKVSASRSAPPPPLAKVVAEPATDDSAQRRRLGKYELQERIGAGSFGVVYRAWDTVLRHQVTLKILESGPSTTPADVDAFLREARLAIALRHPNIVAIHDAGSIDGLPCLIRSYVDGETLAERLIKAPISPREAASLLLPLVEALDHAHEEGIIHRDLKPANILLDRDGRPLLTDFGLSKRQGGDTTLTPDGPFRTVIGTPAYMSPEQVMGNTQEVDARSDIFAAGVILYEMLAGGLPFRGRGRVLEKQIMEARPTPPRELNEEVPRDLEAICLKALARSPADRYPSARAMADDLRLFLDGRPVEPIVEARPARPPAREGGTSRWAMIAIVLLAVGLIATIFLLASSEIQHRREFEALRAAFQARGR